MTLWIDRRALIGAFSAAALAGPLAARAQQTGKVRHVAVLMGGVLSSDAEGQAEAAAFEAGLKELGWHPGGNIALDYRWPGAELDQVTAAANEITAAKPELVVSRSTPATVAIVNRGLPVVFVLVADPAGSGIVQNLGQPGGNITGFAIFESSVGGKWLGLLKQAAPTLSRVSLLFNPATAPFAEGYLRSAQAAAQTLGATVIPAPCGSTGDIENAVAARAREGGGLIVSIDTFLVEHRDLVIALATRYRLPAIYGSEVYVPAGGLMSYGADYPDVFRRAAAYVDKVLRGTRPGELPVQQPAKFTLSINLKSAKEIGLTLPQALIAEADEVIE